MNSAPTRGKSSSTPHPMSSERNFLELLGLCEIGNHQDPEVRLTLLGRMLSAIRFRDEGVFFHSRRVAIIAVGISQRLGWSTEEVQSLEVAALLHDFGKVGVPDHVLQKPGRLNADERELIRTSHDIAEILLQASRFDATTLEIFRDSAGLGSDGTGLLGRHLGARILTVADAFDSLTHHQAHRRALSRTEALEHLQNTDSTKFDRNVLAALQRWLKSDDSQALDQAAEFEEALRDNHQTDPEVAAQASSLCHMFSHLSLLENLYDAYYLIDQHHRIVVWSRGAEKMFGQQRSEILGQTWSQSFVEYTAKGLKNSVIETAIEHQKPFMVLVQAKTSEGPLEAEAHAIPVYAQDGSFRGACEIIHRANSTRRGGDRFEELQKAATRDPLTGLANRAELEKHLAKVFADAQHPGAVPFSAVFLDIDHFKSINDDHSHRVGDEVLKDISHLLEDELYSGELVARYGGEEFVVICPETPLADAVQRADRLRRAVVAATLGGLKVTASFGVAQLEEGDTTESVLRRADAALYDAKRSGRNRTCHRSQKQGGAEDSAQTVEVENPYRFKTTLQATVAENMIATKLAGFVDANHAKVFDVTPEGFKVRLGDTTLFGGWGSTPDRQPVEVTVTIGKLDRSRRNPMVAINVLIEPRGRKPAVEVFQQRASHIREEIRAYCAAN